MVPPCHCSDPDVLRHANRRPATLVRIIGPAWTHRSRRVDAGREPAGCARHAPRRPRRQDELLGDLFVRHSGDDKLGDLALTGARAARPHRCVTFGPLLSGGVSGVEHEVEAGRWWTSTLLVAPACHRTLCRRTCFRAFSTACRPQTLSSAPSRRAGDRWNPTARTPHRARTRGPYGRTHTGLGPAEQIGHVPARKYSNAYSVRHTVLERGEAIGFRGRRICVACRPVTRLHPPGTSEHLSHSGIRSRGRAVQLALTAPAPRPTRSFTSPANAASRSSSGARRIADG